MTTQRMYSLVGFLALALFVVLGTGCGGDRTVKKQQAIETDYQVPEMAAMEGITYAEDDAETISDEPTGEDYEGSMPMGYQEPGYSDAAETGMVVDDESCEPVTTSVRCYDEEDSCTEVTEECGMVGDDESACQDEALTPAVAAEEEEDISAEDNDEWDEESEARDEIAEDSTVMEEEETSSVADNTDEGDSGTVAGYIGSEDETATDPNLDSETGATTSEGPAEDSGDNPDSGLSP